MVTSVPMNFININVAAWSSIKENPLSVADPPGVMMETSPDIPFPTTASAIVSEIILKEAAGSPPKLIDVASLNPFPLIVTIVPAEPLVG